MGHDELTDRARQAAKNPARVPQRMMYTLYGLHIADGLDRSTLEEDPGPCRNDGRVGVFWAGVPDKPMTFLAVKWSSIWPGEYVFHSGERPNATKFERDLWNRELQAAAEWLGAEIVEGPGWFTIPSEG